MVKEIIRSTELSSHLSTFEQKPKVVKKQKKEASQYTSQLVEETPVRKPPHKASNPKKTLPSADYINTTPIAMAGPISRDSKNRTTNRSKAVTHNEQTDRTMTLHSKSAESFGSSLMKVCIVCTHCDRAHRI